MDLGDCMSRAVRAARRGDLDSLEVELSRMRSLPAEAVGSLRANLRALAESVQIHPSYAPAARAHAG